MEFNPFSPEFKANPYPTYAELRESAPVVEAGMGAWCVSRYDDVAAMLKNHGAFSSKAIGMQIKDKPTRTIINTDPPEHTTMRGLVNRAFTPRMVADLEPRIRELTRELLDRVAGAGQMELMGDLAIPLPVSVIAIILGVGAERRDDFKRWSNAVIASDSVQNEEGREAHRGDIDEFMAYFERIIDERRKQPRPDDLISALVAAESSDLKLEPDDVLAFTGLLLIAGNETTTNLIGNAVLALLEYPEQMAMVRDDAARIPNMIEEALRYDSPVQFLFRVTTQDVELGGQAIPAGKMVVPMYASGNRDERRFPAADKFDITRNTQGHLAFGLGVHFCLGAPLARLEAKVVFEELFARVGEISAAGEMVRNDSLFLRGLKRFPLAFTPARVSV
jgi:cytochrome P450